MLNTKMTTLRELQEHKEVVNTLADLEKMAIPEENALQFVRQAAEIGLKVAEPLERVNERSTAHNNKVIGWLIAALILSNLFWGIIHGYAIYKAYQEPATYEYTQEQGQDGSSQSQVAGGKGGSS